MIVQSIIELAVFIYDKEGVLFFVYLYKQSSSRKQLFSIYFEMYVQQSITCGLIMLQIYNSHFLLSFTATVVRR
jgi:hypothetical protein